MNLLTSFGIGVVTLIVILVIISVCLPSRIHIQRDIVINAPAEATYEQIHELRNWSKWVPWHQNDPKTKLTYAGPTQGEGAKYSWTSQQSDVKTGKVTILKAEQNKRLVTNLEMENSDIARGTFTLEETQEGTKLTLYLDKYMGDGTINKFSGLLVNSTVGEDFEKGLENIKREVESRQELSEN
ncbi:hypothetical protein OB13_04090 [Pontibacter sp. HJ8]